ncbi:MAG: type II toxin-antitoxin system VapC family toxin [Marmoricola sp.]
MIFLLDTNVISELRKPRPNRGVVSWFEAVDDDALRLSVLVLGEIRNGVERLRARDLISAVALDAWLTQLHRRFHDRIAPVTTDIADQWGRITASQPLPIVDSLLAATALTHGWTLVSRNERDLTATGVALLNPFE